MKRALIIVPFVLVVLLAVALVAPGFMDWNQYKGQAQQQVKTYTGLDLELAGDIGFTILPSPRFMAEGVTIKAPEGSKSETLVAFERLDVNVDLMPLLSQKLSIKYITLVKPHVNLEMLETGKLNAMTPELEALTGGEQQDQSQSAKTAPPAISLDKIVIDDGQFSYYDHKTKAETLIRNINADLMAKTLFGPYQANGSLFYEGNSADFDLQAEKFDAKAQQLNPKLKLTLQPGDIELSYAGTLNFKETVGGQGALSLNIPNVAKALEQNKISGINGLNVPLKVKGLLTADTQKADYRDFELSLGENAFTGSFGALVDPLKYALELKTQKTANIAELLPDLAIFKKGTFNLKVEGDGQTTKIHEGVIKLDDHEFSLSGAYTPQTKSGRPLAVVDFSTAVLDIDTLSKKMPASKEQYGDLESSLRTASLLFDMDLNLNAKKLKYQGQNLENIGVKAKFRDNAVSVSGLTLKNFAKSDIVASGGIDNIKALSGIALNLSVDTRDVQALAKALSVDASSLPKDMGKASIKAKLTGSADAMDMTANIAALNGELITQGKVKTPLQTPSVSGMTVQLKHKNMAEAMQKFSGAAEQDPNFKKPMDVYAKISQDGQTYTLAGLKGDLAGFTVQGDAKVDLSATKPYLSGDLKFGKVVLASSVTTGNTAQKSTAERWSKDTIDTAGLHAINADINLSASSITYGPWPLEAPRMKLALKDGVMEITEMQAGLFEGSIAMSSTVKSANQSRQPIHIAAKSSLTDVSVARLVKALAGSQMIDASGKVSTELDITTSGTSPAALVYDLGGQGTVTGGDIVLNGVDVTRFAEALSDESKPGDSLLGLWKGTTKGGRTAFDTLDGNYVIREGVITIQKLDLDGPEANIATMGTVNLPKWTLSTKHKITVKPQGDVPADIPPFEMAFSGPLDNPAQTFGQGVMQDYLNRKINRKFEKLLTDKLGLPGEEKKKPAKGLLQEVLPSSGEEQEITPKELTPQDILQQVLDPAPEPAAPKPQPEPVPAPTEPPPQDVESIVKEVLQPEPQPEPEAPLPQEEPPAAQQEAPAEEPQAQPPQQQEQQPEEIKPEDVVEDVLKGLLQ
ncbi:MAG: AsmA family protein [Alphaproteobacteria bacterium]|nr:AsmA family protein [Alphaproteobacteria bacterium]